MAAAAETTDEFKELLTCSICLEVFRNPKYLPCLHTFCQVCINTFISSSLLDNKKGINCPVCRKFVSLEGSSNEPETWAAELHNNYLITSLISLHAIKTSKRFCDGCQSGDVTKTAISWCTVCAEAYCGECVKDHKKFRMSLNHRIISLEEYQSGKYSVDNSEFVACDAHKDKSIEVYCVDHCKPCCTVCATMSHRKCEIVTSIDKAVSGIKTAAQTVQLQEQLQEFTRKLENSVKKKRDNISKLEQETKNIRQQADISTDNMIEHIRKIKQSFGDSLAAKKKEMLMELDEEKEDMLNLISSVTTLKSILDTCLKYGSDVQCLIEVNRLLSMKDEVSNRVEKAIANTKTKSIIFKPCDMVTDFPKNVELLGRVNTVGSRTGLPSVDMRTGSLKVLLTIDVNDFKSGNNYGSGIFLGDMTILTDFQNSKILAYNNEGEILSHLQLSNTPSDITKVTDNTVAVSSRESQQTHVINIKDMILQNTITINVPVFGLVYVDNQYIVGGGSTLTWVDASSGSKIEDVKTNGGTYYLYAYGRKDYVYANGSTTVSCTSNGQTKFTYNNQDLVHPRGIDIDFQGNIYICVFSSNNIHQISSEGKLIRIIPSTIVEIQKPRVIRFKTNSNRFLLTSLCSGKVVICEIS